MSGSLDHLPKEKAAELNLIADFISQNAEVDMLILYGSHARGDWVSDKYVKDNTTYEYQSDFDILVVVRSEKIAKNYSLWSSLEAQIRTNPAIKTTVSLVVDTIHFVNKKLREGNYFYIDIRNEGIVLYDSGRYTLVEPTLLSPEELKVKAQKDFDYWYTKALDFEKDFLHNLDDNVPNNAAFHLHQVTESLFVTVLLVFTGYKPKTHSLEKLEHMAGEIDAVFRQTLPRVTTEDKRLFTLLRNAYTDARYEQDYMISLAELRKLYAHVLELKETVRSRCSAFITGKS